MADGHPLMIYRRWVHRWDQEILWHVGESGTQLERWPARRVQRLPDHSWQVVFSLLVEARSTSRAAITLTRTLNRFVRCYSPRTRLRVRAPHRSRFNGPLHLWARESFTPHVVRANGPRGDRLNKPSPGSVGDGRSAPEWPTILSGLICSSSTAWTAELVRPRRSR